MSPWSSRRASSADSWRRRVSSPRKSSSSSQRRRVLSENPHTRAAWAKEGAEAMTGKTACWRWERLKFSIRRTFPDNSGHSAPVSGLRDDGAARGMGPLGVGTTFGHYAPCCLSGMVNFCLRSFYKLRDGRREVVPDRCNGRECVSRIGNRQLSDGGKCQTGVEGRFQRRERQERKGFGGWTQTKKLRALCDLCSKKGSGRLTTETTEVVGANCGLRLRLRLGRGPPSLNSYGGTSIHRQSEVDGSLFRWLR